MAWGVWQIPESRLGVLGEVAGRIILELGCGGAQWSVALARAGARVIGLDLSERQLDHARQLVQATGVPVALVQASGEAVPLVDASVDIVVCDYGAMTLADPYRTVPEVARLLRPGGLLAFNTSSPLPELCWPDDGVVPAALWRVDPAVPVQRAGDPRPDRVAAGPGCGQLLSR